MREPLRQPPSKALKDLQTNFSGFLAGRLRGGFRTLTELYFGEDVEVKEFYHTTFPFVDTTE